MFVWCCLIKIVRLCIASTLLCCSKAVNIIKILLLVILQAIYETGCVTTGGCTQTKKSCGKSVA